MTVIQTKDGFSLEARWDDTAEPASSVVVLCHPHPLEGGTMDAPLLRTVTTSLNAAGTHVLRFNFRGVGSSEGTWDQGIGEMRDVAAAVEAAQLAFPTMSLGIAGWSFGATTSLGWQLETGSALPWVGIAPGIQPYRGSTVPDFVGLAPADRLIILGDRDQFASVESMEHFAAQAKARLEVLPGSDHFFHFHHETVGSLVAAHLKAD
ncbi:MAG: alpha/beta family hydrolase [Acidimicrobiia bacterium]